MDDKISNAYVKQLAAIGYNKQELCRKFHCDINFFLHNYDRPYKEGQKLYVEKVIKQDKLRNY